MSEFVISSDPQNDDRYKKVLQKIDTIEILENILMKKTITQTREAIYSRLRELMQLDDTDDVEHALLHGDRNCRYLRAHGSHDWEAWRYSYAGLSEEGKKCRICGRSVVTRSINAPDT